MSSKVIDQTNFSFPGQQAVYHGKVRDVYDLGNSLLLVATDRYSAFDRNLALIPEKGALLTAISAWWFNQTQDIVPNHIISVPDPNVVWGRKYKVVPIEMVVRGFITGVTNTSLWHTYSEGQRDFGDFTLPDGLKKNDALPHPVLTPTTKFEEHDRNLTPQQAVNEGLVDDHVWQRMQEVALKLFEYGQKTAAEKGLILVDTKYEFGLDEQNNLVLIDEIHTPDSSRYWLKDQYKASLAKGEEPENYDKEFLRLWFKQRFDPYKDKEAPKPEMETLMELQRRYRYVYEKLTGQSYQEAHEENLLQRIEQNVTKAIQKNG